MQPTVSVLSHLRLDISIIQVQAFVMHSGFGVELWSYTRTLSDRHFPEAEWPPEKAQKHMPRAARDRGGDGGRNRNLHERRHLLQRETQNSCQLSLKYEE